MAETRWEQARAQERADGQGGYGAHFARLIADGADVEGEARLADALVAAGGADPRRRAPGWAGWVPRCAAAGHHVVGVDFDAEIIEQSREHVPRPPGGHVPARRPDARTRCRGRASPRRTTWWSASAT